MTTEWNKWSDCYKFDTGAMFGMLEPYSYYHGVCGLIHRDQQVNLVMSKSAFLNAEYYIKPGARRKIAAREVSHEQQTTHELIDDTAIVHFPPDSDYGFSMDLAYCPHDDMVDMQMTITPTRDLPQCEILFASYVCQAFDETWALLKNSDGAREWVKLDNRGVLNKIFGVVRSEGTSDSLAKEFGCDQTEEQICVEDRPFAKPILVARNSVDGFALLFLSDPRMTRYLTGQYHIWNTAHDWSYGADLQQDHQNIAHTRLICRQFKDANSMCDAAEQLWAEFEKEI